MAGMNKSFGFRNVRGGAGEAAATLPRDRLLPSDAAEPGLLPALLIRLRLEASQGYPGYEVERTQPETGDRRGRGGGSNRGREEGDKRERKGTGST